MYSARPELQAARLAHVRQAAESRAPHLVQSGRASAASRGVGRRRAEARRPRRARVPELGPGGLPVRLLRVPPLQPHPRSRRRALQEGAHTSTQLHSDYSFIYCARLI